MEVRDMRMVLKGLLPVVALVAAWSLAAWWSPLPAGAQAPAPASAVGATRIAFIDSQRVVARSAAGVAARDALEREKAVMQKKLDGEQAELTKLKEDLEKKGQLLSAEVRKEKTETLERRVRDLRRLVDDFEKDYQKKDRELMGKFLRELSGVVQKVGKEKGFTMIVDARGAGVIYGAPEADLTEEIIRAFDDETKKAKK
jgi:outer membrane protein